MNFAWRILICWLAAFPFGSANAANAPGLLDGPVQIVPFRFEITSDNVGKAKLGIPCFPSRKLKWSQIGKPSSDEVDGRVSTLLAERGLEVSALQAEPWRDVRAARTYLRGTLLAVNFDVCVPYLGVGEFKPRGQGMIEVRWEILSATGERLDQRTVKQSLDIKGRDPRSDGSIILDGVQASMTSFLFPALLP